MTDAADIGKVAAEIVNLAARIVEVAAGVGRVAAIIVNLAARIGNTAASILKIAAGIGKVAATIVNLAERIGNTAAGIGKVAAAILQVAAAILQVADCRLQIGDGVGRLADAIVQVADYRLQIGEPKCGVPERKNYVVLLIGELDGIFIFGRLGNGLKIKLKMTDKTSYGVKIHDIHHGLIQSSGAIVETEFDFLKTLGAAIQIATIIKDHEVISDLKPLYAAAGELKINRALTKEALTHLEKLNFVRLKQTTGKNEISRIDVNVPNHQKIYYDFGDYFLSENESMLALGTMNILEKLSAFPHKEQEIISSLSLDTNQYEQIKDVCKGASLIDSYLSPTDSKSVLFSPLYWEDNPNKIFELLERHKTEEFLTVINKIKDYQGLPDLKLQNDEILRDAIKIGCLPTLSVNSTNGLRKFIFTPRTGVGKTEKDFIHKARVLISCVRYGENFAGITKIFNPEALINALVRKGYIGGHSESLMQYEPARNIGLVKLIPSAGNRYEVHFIDNDENKKIVRMAIEMLQIGESSKFDNTEESAKKILLPGNILHHTQTRTHVLQEKVVEKSRSTIERINDLLRGIDQ